ncbi:MAG: DUF192 domain-containing protein [Chloroflexi bacterium]|nr:DUF192 domain-containing protein [Chloroflexota bacterium]
MSNKILRAVNKTRGVPIVTQGILANTWWTRLKGLLGHAPLKSGEGLLLKGEKAIHTVGMSFPIDVLFLDRTGRLIHLMTNMGPLRFSPLVFGATDVLEIAAGQATQTGTTLGDQIEISFV